MSVFTWPGTVPFPNMYTTCVFTVLQYTGVSICTCTGRSSDQFADDVPNTPYSWKNFILNQNRVYSNFFHCWAILRNLFQQLDSRCVKSNLILLCCAAGVNQDIFESNGSTQGLSLNSTYQNFSHIQWLARHFYMQLIFRQWTLAGSQDSKNCPLNHDC